MHPQGTREFDEQGQLQQTRVTVNVAASTDARMPSEHGQSATRLWSPSSQHNLTSSTHSVRCHGHAVLRANKLTRFHACVSATERTASGIQQQHASRDITFFPFTKPQMGSHIQQNRALNILAHSHHPSN
jgi:hypothetical protein